MREKDGMKFEPRHGRVAQMRTGGKWAKDGSTAVMNCLGYGEFSGCCAWPEDRHRRAPVFGQHALTSAATGVVLAVGA